MTATAAPSPQADPSLQETQRTALPRTISRMILAAIRLAFAAVSRLDQDFDMKMYMKLKKIVFTLSMLSVFFFLTTCRTYEVASVVTDSWPSDIGQARTVGIGFFEANGVTKTNQNNLNESLAFALRERGFVVRESQETAGLLARNELAVNRQLSENEVIRFSTMTDARILLQGRFEEILTRTLLDDLHQVLLHIAIFELRSGKKIGEIKLYGKDLKYHTGRETLDMARKVADQFQQMLAGR